MMRKFSLLLCLALIAACATVPDSEREQLLMTSPEMEQALGQYAFRRATLSARFIEEGEDYERLQRVGERIVEVAQPQLEARGFGDLEWSFHLVDDPRVNAFVAPSGQVVFFQGILPILEDENGVAAVMGHEVAHVIARHGGERLSQKLLISSGLLTLSALMNSGSDEREHRVLALLGLGATMGLEFPFSRDREREADYLGTRLMAKAGYDPEAAVVVWERMEEATLNIPSFLSTHPHSGERQQFLKTRMPEFQALRPDASEQE